MRAGRSPRIERRSLVSFANGLLDLDQAPNEDGTLVLVPHNPRWFSTVQLPYAFDTAAQCPLWQATLADLLPPTATAPKDARVAVLQEFMGLSLLPGELRYQKS